MRSKSGPTLSWRKPKKKNPPRRRYPELLQRGKKLYAELNCAGCHDLAGEKTKPTGARLDLYRQQARSQPRFRRCESAAYAARFLLHKIEIAAIADQQFPHSAGRGSGRCVVEELAAGGLVFQSGIRCRTERSRSAWPGSLPGFKSADSSRPTLKLPDGTPAEQAAWLTKTLNRGRRAQSAQDARFPLNDADAEGA